MEESMSEIGIKKYLKKIKIKRLKEYQKKLQG